MPITAQQFAEMQRRLSGKGRVARPESEEAGTSPKGRGSLIREATVVLGVDPSLRGTGYGVIRAGRPEPSLMAQGTIRCPARWERSRCLARIATELREVVTAHSPEVCVVEGLFFAQNLQTALIMGEARGAALATVATAAIPIFEMAPRRVKQAIVGYGAAQKEAVARMVQRMLELPEIPDSDAADALALALVYLQGGGRSALNPLKPV
jgi:crossover junction endodeoxyribonuclease RuvC